MLKWTIRYQRTTPPHLRIGVTVHDLENRFEYEDRQEVLNF